MTTAPSIPTSRNEAWGFQGAMHDSAGAWPLAMTAIAQATGEPVEAVRSFLDSRHGRHFAEDVQIGLQQGQTRVEAIDAAVQRWMHWTVDRRTRRDYDMPRGLPYLRAWVIHCDLAEAA